MGVRIDPLRETAHRTSGVVAIVARDVVLSLTPIPRSCGPVWSMNGKTVKLVKLVFSDLDDGTDRRRMDSVG
jgi:hypothetical protein